MVNITPLFFLASFECRHRASKSNLHGHVWSSQVPTLMHRLHLSFDDFFLGIDSFYDFLDHITNFFFAYSVLAKPEDAFILDVRLVLAKLGQHLVLDGLDCIDSGIDIPLQRLP
jgi:hypothetical protein